MKNIEGMNVVCRVSPKGYDEYLSDDGWCRDIFSALSYNKVKSSSMYKRLRVNKGKVVVRQVTRVMILDSMQLSHYKSRIASER